MKVSDYIVDYLKQNKITDFFGYPGGMVTHLMDSFDKIPDINAHLCYHEQAAAFSACGYAQTTGVPGMAYATSGPGATNLITGICNAYFDSIPTIFITGQVNTYESKKNLNVRQRGFQETDIVGMVKNVTNYAAVVENCEDIKYHLEKALFYSQNGRPGPVILDIPMNVQRADIDVEKLKGFEHPMANVTNAIKCEEAKSIILESIKTAKRPIILAGSGVKTARVVPEFRKLVDMIGIPVVTSMLGVDILPNSSPYNFGFIGAYGHRYANFVISKSDLIIVFGSRLDYRQTGANLESFAKSAKIIRIDVDSNELENRIKPEEKAIELDLSELIPKLCEDKDFGLNNEYNDWLNICNILKEKLSSIDKLESNKFVSAISEQVPDNYTITTDVGQNQVWVAQSFKFKELQRALFTGGHGAMGYSLPAAIGAYYGVKRPVVCFCGDGGFQMNIQELEFLAREKIPVKIILLNNKSLGMIRHFQEMYFESKYVQTKEKTGYSTPDFCKIVNAYGIDNIKISSISEIPKIKELLEDNKPQFIEINLCGETYVFPKLEYNKPIEEQEPLIDRDLFELLTKL